MDCDYLDPSACTSPTEDQLNDMLGTQVHDVTLGCVLDINTYYLDPNNCPWNENVSGTCPGYPVACEWSTDSVLNVSECAEHCKNSYMQQASSLMKNGIYQLGVFQALLDNTLEPLLSCQFLVGLFWFSKDSLCVISMLSMTHVTAATIGFCAVLCPLTVLAISGIKRFNEENTFASTQYTHIPFREVDDKGGPAT
eukprot:TRINITY_DN2730_c0_g1_i1.p1 TRINITY_DN2730_c0_g1~~TRINITY_DN2730_c0_g1_i1.p1  ORF type:complete len:196 (-),score=45.17 TRINITY_DN2730_c0_g1_i1:8-595(-)